MLVAEALLPSTIYTISNALYNQTIYITDYEGIVSPATPTTTPGTSYWALTAPGNTSDSDKLSNPYRIVLGDCNTGQPSYLSVKGSGLSAGPIYGSMTMPLWNLWKTPDGYYIIGDQNTSKNIALSSPTSITLASALKTDSDGSDADPTQFWNLTAIPQDPGASDTYNCPHPQTSSTSTG